MFEDELTELIDDITVNERLVSKKYEEYLEDEDDLVSMYLAAAEKGLSDAIEALTKLYSTDYIYDSSLSQ